jgi:cytoskeletal protein RodZ
MKIEALKNKTESLTKILLTVAVVLGVLTFLRIGSFVSSSEAMTMTQEADPAETAASEVKKVLAQTRARADEIKKNNLFAPPPVRQHPVSAINGILGREVLIGEKWYKVGDSVGEAKIVAIEPTKVRIAWNGQEKEFSPIGVPGASSGSPSGPAAPSAKPGPGTSASTVITGSRRGPGQLAGLPAQEKDRRRQQWMNTSPEQQQRLRDEFRQKSGRKAG